MVLPGEGIHAVTLRFKEGESENVYLGITQDPFDQIKKDSSLGESQHYSISYHFFDGKIHYNSKSDEYGPPLHPGDIISAIFDMDLHTLSF